MNKITELSITAYLHLQAVRARAAEQLAAQDPEQGSSSAETAVIIAMVVLLAVTVITIIGKKVIDKAESISF